MADYEYFEIEDEDGIDRPPTNYRERFKFSKLWVGPTYPREPQVTLFFPRLQLFPQIFASSMSKRSRFFGLVVLWLLWFITNVVLADRGVLAISHAFKTSDQTSGTGDINSADTIVPLLGCGWNGEYWAGPFQNCGVDGADCIDSLAGTRLNFKCPANCGNDGWTYEPWPVGGYVAMREPIIVGGPEIYRGDSFICEAALHAGIVSPHSGGCGTLEWIGPHSQFQSTKGKYGSTQSLAFDSEFPLNFRFVTEDLPNITNCKDIKILHIAVNVIFILVAAYMIPTEQVALYYLGTLATFGFWTVILAAHPPLRGGSPELNGELISLGFRRFLPYCLSLVAIYVFACRPQLQGMRASFSRLVFWGTGFILGILENYVFSFIPIDRLIISDLNAQPGAWVALISVVVLLLLIAVGQAYTFWMKGEFRKYITAYIVILATLIVLSFWPGQTLRLHHYFFGLIFLPGTCLQTTPSLFYQGLLFGLYTSGIARWGYDSILQTSSQLSRVSSGAGSAFNSDAMIKFLEPFGSSLQNFVLQWQQDRFGGEKPNGFSITINDVERFRTYNVEQDTSEPMVSFESVENSNLLKMSFNLSSWLYDNIDPERRHQKWYVRVALATLGYKNQPDIGKYSAPLVVNTDASFQID